jgi:hypothetical protein
VEVGGRGWKGGGTFSTFRSRQNSRRTEEAGSPEIEEGSVAGTTTYMREDVGDRTVTNSLVFVSTGVGCAGIWGLSVAGDGLLVDGAEEVSWWVSW